MESGAYKKLVCKEELEVEAFYSIHYFQYMSSFYFPGERHGFWEFVCVDKGEVLIGAGEKTYRLKTGEMVFHEPWEFHWVKATGEIAPNLVVISFSSASEIMDFFRKKRFTLSGEERKVLAALIGEARHALEGRLDDPYQKELVMAEKAAPAALQLMTLYLKQFLILLYRRNCGTAEDADRRAPVYEKTSRNNYEENLFAGITSYMKENIGRQLKLEQICRENLIGKAKLQKVVHQMTGMGVIDYFVSLKIETAKEYIRNEKMNFSQIAEKLGYSSQHYFSRQFKSVTGMTPTEYASSIKAMAEKEKET